MKTKTIHFILTIACLLMLTFLLTEAYLLPFDKTNEVITQRIQRGRIYYVSTNKRWYAVPLDVYATVLPGYIVCVDHSAIAHSVQVMTITYDDKSVFDYNIGYVRRGGGIFMGILMLISILFLIFYDQTVKRKSTLRIFIPLVLATAYIIYVYSCYQ
jgi:hypothetical protein